MPEAVVTQGSAAWSLLDGEALWIFPVRPVDAVNQWVDFLHGFSIGIATAEAELRISADTDFVVWLDGRLIGQGQYSDYPDRKTYERFSLGDTLQPGRHTLAVTVFYNGRSSSVYRRGEPGLLFSIHAGAQPLAASGMQTRWRDNPCYASGPIAIVSHQLSYTFGYDARNDDGFYGEGYVPGSAWKTMGETEATRPAERLVLQPRPVARLVDAGVTPATLVAAGRFRLDRTVVEAAHVARWGRQTLAGLTLDSVVDAPAPGAPTLAPVSPAWQIQHAVLSPVDPSGFASVAAGTLLGALPDGLRVLDQAPDGDGVFLLFDMGREEAGYLELEIEAPAGTLVDLGYGEHLDDGHVRSFVGGRSFAGRYVCREGRQVFVHRTLRWAGRYLQLHVHGSVFTLYQLGLRRLDYPVTRCGGVTTGVPLHRQLFEVGCRTLQLCMHEHYEDTPWREQALYANDARTQALCGYYAFGEAAMPAASFTLLGHGQRDDGFLYLTAPAKQVLTIPSFTFVWMLAVRDHYLYTGDASLVRTFLPQIGTMLERFLGECKDGLLPLRQDKPIWNFYDWSAGMSGYKPEEFDRGLDADAPLNCFLILALEATLQMLDWVGERQREDFATAVTSLRNAVAARFWVPTEDAFRTHALAGSFTQLTQALAILAGVGDADMRERVLNRMGRPDSGLAAPGLSQSFYTFEALMQRKALYGAPVLAGIEATWGKMLEAGATTFWETSIGASDFHNAGSLCHGWSAVPVYVLHHDVLGVRPLTPGFRSFVVEPMNMPHDLAGRVPFPGGEIQVRREPVGSDEVDLTVTITEPGIWSAEVNGLAGDQVPVALIDGRCCIRHARTQPVKITVWRE
ncbi:MAG TPA: hypothetical protein DCS43_04010 [Verrucomicrobia bacterium]|nr:hypothetical protein [Verrucomicrobiota bacterium]